MIENYTAAKFWFDLAQTLITGLIAVYVWLSNRQRVTTSRIDRLEKTINDRICKLETESDSRLDTHRDRLTVIETKFESIPSHKELTSLLKSIGDLAGKMERLDGRLSGINRAVDLLNQHHLNTGGKQ